MRIDDWVWQLNDPGRCVRASASRTARCASSLSICSSFLYSCSSPSAASTVPEPDLRQQVRVAEREPERDRERVLVGVLRDGDALGGERRQLRVGVLARLEVDVEVAVHHRVGTEADGGELVGDAGVHERVVAAVRRELHSERRKEFVVRDVLHLCAHHPPRDLVLLVAGERCSAAAQRCGCARGRTASGSP